MSESGESIPGGSEFRIGNIYERLLKGETVWLERQESDTGKVVDLYDDTLAVGYYDQDFGDKLCEVYVYDDPTDIDGQPRLINEKNPVNEDIARKMLIARASKRRVKKNIPEGSVISVGIILIDGEPLARAKVHKDDKAGFMYLLNTRQESSLPLIIKISDETVDPLEEQE